MMPVSDQEENETCMSGETNEAAAPEKIMENHDAGRARLAKSSRQARKLFVQGMDYFFRS